MARSHVVTGGGRGVGRAVVERLLRDGDSVVAVEADPRAVDWVGDHPAAARIHAVVGDAADDTVAQRAVDLAGEAGVFTGWVNNAAVFRDASIHTSPSGEVLDLIVRNLNPAVVGCAAAVRGFLAAGSGGAIVNVSSHQAQRAVPGCLPYATAKAAVEGLTRALAVEYGGRGIRTNAVALGSITTERYEALLASLPDEEAARIQDAMGALHPVGRVGRAEEVAAVVAHLLSDDAGFVNGAIVPVDGGRSVLAQDPEAHSPA